ncbi:MAG: hypothetical protein AB1414_17240 [bacterium]
MKKMIIALSILLLPAMGNADSCVGKYCFKCNDFTDTWVWCVDLHNYAAAVSVTGSNPVYPSAMAGGGYITNDNHVYLTVMEIIPNEGIYGVHMIDLDLATMTGVDDLVWYNNDGTVGPYYTDLPFSQISCPVDCAKGSGETTLKK